MFNQTIGIKSLLAFFLTLILCLEIGFISLFSIFYTHLHRQFILEKFERNLIVNSQDIEQKIRQGKNNLLRLKDYISLLDAKNLSSQDALPYLAKIMARNLQFNPHEYNCYFALEPALAQKYFGENGYVLTVHKNYELINTDDYGQPNQSIVETWNDPGYQTNPSEIWYHIAKKSHQIELSPIYFDSTYMKAWLYTLGMGIYDHDVFQGMVGIDILLDSWFDSIERIKVDQTGGLFLVDSESGLVLTKVGQSNYQQENLITVNQRLSYYLWDTDTEQSVWQSIIKNDSSGVLVKGKDNSNYLVSSVRLKELPLTLVIYGNQRDLQGIIYDNLAIFITIGLIFLALVLGLSIWLQQNLTLPLTNLIAMMEKLAKNKFSSITDSTNQEIIKYQLPTTGIVETQQLGKIFNHLLKQLQAAFTALAISNNELENRVVQRTQELAANNTQLEQTLSSLQTTQAQLIQAEKMASLGQMLAGIAHEINNPVSFIYGNLTHVTEYIQDLLGLIRLYQQQYPQPTPEIKEEIEAIDLDYIRKDLPSILSSMEIGVKRISGIVNSLRTFSRLDEAEFKAADINEGIESALMILRHRFQSREECPEILVIQDCGDLPLVHCYASLLNQVFLNLIVNAIDAVEERLLNKYTELEPGFVPLIEIRTEVTDRGWVAIHIIDNGGGIEEKVRSKIFDPFFTTKPIGKGTGLGLSVCYQIIVDKHGGKIECNSTPGEGTEFSIEIPLDSPLSWDKV